MKRCACGMPTAPISPGLGSSGSCPLVQPFLERVSQRGIGRTVAGALLSCFLNLQEDEDENAEENEEYREGKLQWQGGHGEAATYEGGDEEDKAIAAAARRASERQDLVASGDESDDKVGRGRQPRSIAAPDNTASRLCMGWQGRV